MEKDGSEFGKDLCFGLQILFFFAELIFQFSLLLPSPLPFSLYSFPLSPFSFFFPSPDDIQTTIVTLGGVDGLISIVNECLLSNQSSAESDDLMKSIYYAIQKLAENGKWEREEREGNGKWDWECARKLERREEGEGTRISVKDSKVLRMRGSGRVNKEKESESFQIVRKQRHTYALLL